MIYSYKRTYPKPLPFRIVLSNGQTRTDPSTFAPEEIADAGYILVADKPTILATQTITWDPDTVSWIVLDKSQEQIRAEYLASTPSIVTMRQARLALLSQGLLTTVNTALAAMEGIEGDAARIEWEYATEVDRNSPLVQSLVGALGLTEQQLFDLFLLADSL